MTEKSTQMSKQSIDALKKASIALEDLALALKRVRSDQVLDAVDLLNAILRNARDGSDSAVARGYQSADPNKRFLIGVLPRLLQDRDLFPSNEDITEFASAALKLPMSSTAGMKRARHEIIGKVICETDLLDERQLTDVVRALEQLVGNKDRIEAMVRQKRAGQFSWNETLQSLLRS